MKPWRMQDLCVYLQVCVFVCVKVLKTSDGFPSFIRVYL